MTTKPRFKFHLHKTYYVILPTLHAQFLNDLKYAYRDLLDPVFEFQRTCLGNTKHYLRHGVRRKAHNSLKVNCLLHYCKCHSSREMGHHKHALSWSARNSPMVPEPAVSLLAFQNRIVTILLKFLQVWISHRKGSVASVMIVSLAVQTNRLLTPETSNLAGKPGTHR